MSCMTILFINLQITRSDIRAHKVGCQPGAAYGHFNLPQVVCVGVYGLTNSLRQPLGLPGFTATAIEQQEQQMVGCQLWGLMFQDVFVNKHAIMTREILKGNINNNLK